MAPRISRTRRPILCAVLDGASLGATPERFAKRLFSAGVDWIQLRDRELESDALHSLAAALTSAARSIREGRANAAGEDEAIDAPRVLINRRVDIALATGADGVHLGFDAVDATSARKLLGRGALIGASFHSIAEVERATSISGGVDLSYAHLAPIWDPNSKAATRPPLGPEALRRAAACDLPLLAQGGLDEDRSALAIRCGAAGIAVTGQLSQAQDPTASAAKLRQSLDQDSFPEGDTFRNQNRPTGDTGPMP
jgi:thiamine-phosphate pyrophosphorylase